jgi:hypothetical protein
MEKFSHLFFSPLPLVTLPKGPWALGGIPQGGNHSCAPEGHYERPKGRHKAMVSDALGPFGPSFDLWRPRGTLIEP